MYILFVCSVLIEKLFVFPFYIIYELPSIPFTSQGFYFSVLELIPHYTAPCLLPSVLLWSCFYCLVLLCQITALRQNLQKTVLLKVYPLCFLICNCESNILTFPPPITSVILAQLTWQNINYRHRSFNLVSLVLARLCETTMTLLKLVLCASLR